MANKGAPYELYQGRRDTAISGGQVRMMGSDHDPVFQ
jgi:hypothetical protein